MLARVDKTVIVTGAAGALGRVVAESLARQGARLALVDREERAVELERLSSSLGRAKAYAFDATLPEAWETSLDDASASLGELGGAVLIAGGWAGGRDLADEKDAGTLRRMLETNLVSAERALSATATRLREHGAGSIVLIGSKNVERPWDGRGAAAYTASKSALVALARAAAAELLERGVRVNVVMPSTIDTPANRAAMPSAHHERWVRPEALADVIAFLLSDASRAVSGAAIPVYARS